MKKAETRFGGKYGKCIFKRKNAENTFLAENANAFLAEKCRNVFMAKNAENTSLEVKMWKTHFWRKCVFSEKCENAFLAGEIWKTTFLVKKKMPKTCFRWEKCGKHVVDGKIMENMFLAKKYGNAFRWKNTKTCFWDEKHI